LTLPTAASIEPQKLALPAHKGPKSRFSLSQVDHL
jgi:hypothetical protein